MANVVFYENPEHFWNEVSPHVKKEEAKNSLCLGMSYLFRSNPEDCLYQSALFENNRLQGALVCSRYRSNYNFLPTPVSAPEYATILFDQFKRANISITGIVGELSTANEYEKLFIKSGQKTKVHVKQGIYRCKKVVPPQKPKDILFRKAEIKDVPKIGEWIESFHTEAVPHDPPVNGVELAEAKITKSMIYVLEKNDELVSMAGWGRDIETSCSINLVFTPKPQRGNGYASVVTAQLTQQFLDDGKTETNLYTDMSNPTSNKIYQNIGYEFVCNSIHIGVS